MPNFDTNNGITLATAIASVTPKANSSNCTICTKQDQATCSKFESLQTKVGSHNGIAILCTGLTATNANPVITQLLTWDKAKIILFLDDIVANSSTCPVDKVDQYMKNNIPNITTNTLKAWNIYDQASRPCLRQSDGHLSKLAVAVSNTKLSNAPYNFNTQDFTDISKAIFTANGYTARLDNTVFTNLVSFAQVSASYTNMAKLKAKLSQENSGPEIEGTNFIIRYFGKHKTDFDNGNYLFESYQNEWARYVDVQDNRDPLNIIFYEFKSVLPGSFVDNSFVTQFVKDLSNSQVNNLSQVQWIFDHDKMSSVQVKEKVLAALEKNKMMLETIDLIKIRTLLDNDFIIESNKSQSILDFLNNSTNFYTIFK